jgi:hypothetical protein
MAHGSVRTVAEVLFQQQDQDTILSQTVLISVSLPYVAVQLATVSNNNRKNVRIPKDASYKVSRIRRTAVIMHVLEQQYHVQCQRY